MTFDAIYAAELRYVLNALRRLGVPDRDREDVAHDVFLVVHRQLDTYDSSRAIRPWLFGIAFRVASTYRRKHSNICEDLDGRTVQNEVTDPWPTHQTRQLVVAALGELEWETRAVIIMHDIDGATAPEISQALEIPVNRVYSRLRIARRDFRQAMHKLQEEVG